MRRWLPLSLAFTMILISGIASGLWDNRWFLSTELATMTHRVNEMPLDLGSWKGEEVVDDPEMVARLIKQGTVHAIKTRVYRNINTGQIVNVLLATGRPGPVSTHNPMSCIVNKGVMVQVSDPSNTTIEVPNLGPVTYTRCDIQNSSSGGQTEEWSIFWTWHANNGWIATDDPRMKFAFYRALTKLYVTRSNTEYALGLKKNESPGDDPAIRFLQDCLPVIDRALFQTTSDEHSSSP